jgi:hypothetical protein
MGWFDDFIKGAGNAIMDNVVKPVNDYVVQPVIDNVVQPVVDVIVKPAYTKIYDWATSEQAKEIYEKGKEFGVEISDGFVAGANSIHEGLGDEIKEKIVEGVSYGISYVSQNACNLAVSGATTVIVGTFFTAEKELELAEKLTFMAVDQADFELKRKMISEFAKGLSKSFVEPVYQIPGVPGDKQEVEGVIAYCIYKTLCDDSSKSYSFKSVISGGLVLGITSYVCDGSAPEGYKEWKQTY